MNERASWIFDTGGESDDEYGLGGFVREGKIVPPEKIEVPEGARVLVTLLLDGEAGFWAAASETSLGAVWDNAEDDVYAELLEK